MNRGYIEIEAKLDSQDVAILEACVARRMDELTEARNAPNIGWLPQMLIDEQIENYEHVQKQLKLAHDDIREKKKLSDAEFHKRLAASRAH